MGSIFWKGVTESLSWCWLSAQSGGQGRGLGWKLAGPSFTFFEGGLGIVCAAGHPEAVCVERGDWGPCHWGRVHTCVLEGGGEVGMTGLWVSTAGCWPLLYFLGTPFPNTEKVLYKRPFSFQNAPKARLETHPMILCRIISGSYCIKQSCCLACIHSSLTG